MCVVSERSSGESAGTFRSGLYFCTLHQSGCDAAAAARCAPVLPCASSACTNPDNKTPEGSQERSTATKQGERRGGGGKKGWPAGRRDSPVGVRGLVNDVLVGGQQDQSVLAEIHSHVSVPASIQTAADGERHGMRLQGGRRGGGGGGGSDWWRQRDDPGARAVLAPDHYRLNGLMGPSAEE